MAAFEKSAADNHLIIVLHGDEIIAFSRFHDRLDGVRKIYDIAVSLKFRRKGVGRKLLNWVISLTPNNDSCCVELKCPVDLEANGFYRELGFTKIGEDATKSGRVINTWRFEALVNTVKGGEVP